jgi:DNA-binding NarL/FixJ family response regulator
LVCLSLKHNTNAKIQAIQKKIKKETNKMPKRISQEEHNKRLNLWGKGYSDRKIARECNVSTQTIEQWRKNRDIPANYRMFDTRNNKFI